MTKQEENNDHTCTNIVDGVCHVYDTFRGKTEDHIVTAFSSPVKEKVMTLSLKQIKAMQKATWIKNSRHWGRYGKH